jgi:hypothetical protein
MSVQGSRYPILEWCLGSQSCISGSGQVIPQAVPSVARKYCSKLVEARVFFQVLCSIPLYSHIENRKVLCPLCCNRFTSYLRSKKRRVLSFRQERYSNTHLQDTRYGIADHLRTNNYTPSLFSQDGT